MGRGKGQTGVLIARSLRSPTSVNQLHWRQKPCVRRWRASTTTDA